MDGDYSLYNLEDNLSGSNTDDDHDEINSDLEEKLYSAVFHSNDVSSRSQDISPYNNFTSLSDVISSWKNIPDNKSPQFLNTAKNSDQNNTFESEATRVAATSRDAAIDSEEGKEGENSGLENRESVENSRPRNVPDDQQPRIDVHNNGDIAGKMENMQEKDVVEDRSENEIISGKKSPEKKITKKQRISPRKFPKPKESRGDNSPVKYSRGIDGPEEDYTHAENDLRNNSATASVPQDSTVSSDIRTKEELDKDESMEKERRISLLGHENCAGEEGPERPSSIKPEEQFEKSRSMEGEIVEKRSEEVAGVKPEDEQLEKVKSMENKAFVTSSDSSSSDSSSRDSSSSSAARNTRHNKDVKQNKKTLPVGNEWGEIITLDDSEGSICEIPVPPKPRPPTINLDDSESSTSSDSDSSAETMTPEKLVKSYRMAVSESKSRNQNAGGRKESTRKNNIAQNSACYSSISDNNDSMTESEEENWGIIAGSQINRDIPTTSSSGDVRMSDITDNLSTVIERTDSSCQILEDGDESVDLIGKVLENSIRESQRESGTGSSDIMKKTSGGLLETSLVIDQQLGKEKGQSPSLQTLAENNETENSGGNNKNVVEDDTLLINTECDRSLLDLVGSRAPETSIRISDNRKRPITDSGKKSKHQNSPKKTRSSDDSAVAGSSSSKSPKENKENTEKERNCAADYFFKPMNNEMENYYNKSWGGETFDIDAIRRQMPRDPRHWAVLNEDLLGNQQRRSRYWTESKCRNCNHTGHHMAECPEKRKLPSCHMCGAPGHREPRCPHKMCLGCGKKQKTYMQVCNGCRRAWCNGCQSYGHMETNCPDLWRRYHVTTSHRNLNTHLNAENVMKPQRLLSCCNCAERGHDSTTCDSYRWSRHFPTPSYVTNYTTGPSYGEHRSLEGIEFPSEARDQSGTETRQTDDGVLPTSTPSNEGRKRKSNTAKVTNENPEVGEISRTISNQIDKNVEKAEEQSEEPRKSNKEKTQKSDELISKNSKTTESQEILFTLESKLLDTRIRQAANYGECVVPLLAKQYGTLVSSDLGRTFLQNLTSQFPMKLEIKRCENGGIAMSISSTRDLHYPIHLTITDWLKWRLTEQGRFVKLNLPTTKQDLIKLLKEKLNELKQELGDPFKLFAKIQTLNGQLNKMQRQSAAGKKMATSSNRARIVEELAKSQCKLNMILFGQVKVNKADKSCRFLKSALLAMEKPSSPSYVCAATYLQLVHHYNIIFAAYTPDKLSHLLDIYFQKYSGQGANRKKKVPSIRETNITYANFIKELNKANQNQNTNSSMLNDSTEVILLDGNSERECIGPTVNRSGNSGQKANRKKNVPPMQNVPSIRQTDANYAKFIKALNTVSPRQNSNFSLLDNANKVIRPDVNSERGDNDPASNRTVDYDGVESQFIIPGADLSNTNHDHHSNSPPAQIPFEYHQERQENNYYRSKYNFGDNSRWQRHRSILQNNSQRDNYTALDNHSLQNDHYNTERDFSNIGGGDFNRKSTGHYTEQSSPWNRVNETIENGFENSPGTNVQSNSSPGRNRRRSSYSPRNTSSQDMFFSDRRAEPSQNILHNDMLDGYPRNQVERRNRNDVNNPSTSRMHNQSRIYADNNPNTGAAQNRMGSNKNKKKKKNKGPKLPLYLQKRAEQNIVKYMEVGVPRITRAAIELQEKLKNKDLTLQSVVKFEELVKRKLKKTDHLL